MSQSDQSAIAAIESRLQQLEHEVGVLSEAVLIMSHGAEGGPMADPAGNAATQAARQAYEMLLTLRQGDGPGAGK